MKSQIKIYLRKRQEKRTLGAMENRKRKRRSEEVPVSKPKSSRVKLEVGSIELDIMGTSHMRLLLPKNSQIAFLTIRENKKNVKFLEGY